jgi:starch phosphorylase
MAIAYDTPIPGYKTYNTLNIRLWSAKPSKEFDLEHFNKVLRLLVVTERERDPRGTSDRCNYIG